MGPPSGEEQGLGRPMGVGDKAWGYKRKGQTRDREDLEGWRGKGSYCRNRSSS